MQKKLTLLDVFFAIFLLFFFQGHDFKEGVFEKVLFFLFRDAVLNLLLLLLQFEFDFTSHVQIIHSLVGRLSLLMKGEVHAL